MCDWIVLSVVSVGIAAGAVVTLPAADEPAGEAREARAASGEAPATTRLVALAANAQAVYDELLRISRKIAQDDPKRPTPEDFYAWSQRIESGFVGGESHRQRMRAGLKDAEARLAASQGSKLEVLKWQYYVAEADARAADMAEHFRATEKMREAIKNDPDLQQYLNAATQPSP